MQTPSLVCETTGVVTSPNDALVRGLIVAAPFAALVGVEVDVIEVDRVRLRLPFRPEVTTIADLVHGGAIASLIDVAATAAAWSGAEAARSSRGTTIGFTVSFLAAGRGQDLAATAEVIQRGRTICVIEVAVAGADGAAVARALVTYKLGETAAAGG